MGVEARDTDDNNRFRAELQTVGGEGVVQTTERAEASTRLETELGREGAIVAMCIYLTKDAAPIVTLEEIQQSLGDKYSLDYISHVLEDMGFRKVPKNHRTEYYIELQRRLRIRIDELEKLVSSAQNTCEILGQCRNDRPRLEQLMSEIESREDSSSNELLTNLRKLRDLMDSIEKLEEVEKLMGQVSEEVEDQQTIEPVSAKTPDTTIPEKLVALGSDMWSRPDEQMFDRTWRVGGKYLDVGAIAELTRDHILEVGPSFF